MCMLCVEIQKQKMTRREVARAYREFSIPDGHFADVMVEIQKHYGLEETAEELNKLYTEELTKGIP